MSTAHPYRVLHFAQVPCKPFVAAAKDMETAVAIAEAVSLQHLFLFDQGIIPDYSNVVTIEVWDGEEWEEVDDDNPVRESITADYEELTTHVDELSGDVKE